MGLGVSRSSGLVYASLILGFWISLLGPCLISPCIDCYIGCSRLAKAWLKFWRYAFMKMDLAGVNSLQGLET
jgi:hypothetical protein